MAEQNKKTAPTRVANKRRATFQRPTKIAAAPTVSQPLRQKFSGLVVSNKMAKTIVVKVDMVKMHTKYHKRFTLNRRYKVHDEKEQYRPGQTVSFVACRPLSKDKKWRVMYQ